MRRRGGRAGAGDGSWCRRSWAPSAWQPGGGYRRRRGGGQLSAPGVVGQRPAETEWTWKRTGTETTWALSRQRGGEINEYPSRACTAPSGRRTLCADLDVQGMSWEIRGRAVDGGGLAHGRVRVVQHSLPPGTVLAVDARAHRSGAHPGVWVVQDVAGAQGGFEAGRLSAADRAARTWSSVTCTPAQRRRVRHQRAPGSDNSVRRTVSPSGASGSPRR